MSLTSGQTGSEIVPVVRPEDIAALPADQRGAVITKALVESKSWLAVATQATDPTPIAEFKAWAATVAEMTRQKGLAEEIQLDALEMVRRAERGIGVSIRNGQAAGEIAKRGAIGGLARAGHLGPIPGDARGHDLARPEQFADRDALAKAIYPMADGVDDDQFDEVLNAARSEGNLSRANVVRKAQKVTAPQSRLQRANLIREMAVQGYSSRQMVAKVGARDDTIREIARSHGISIPADKVTSRTRQIDPERVIQETVSTLQGVEYGLGLLSQADYDAFSPEQARAWLGALNTPARAIRVLLKELNDRA